MANLRILIVADDLLVRTGLGTLIATQSDYRVVGQSNGIALADDIEVFRPDVVLWDLGWNANHVKRLATMPLSQIPFLILLGERESTPTVLSALSQLSVYGVLPRDSHPDTLITALNAIGNNLIVISPQLSEFLGLSSPVVNDTLLEELTPREDEVLQLLAQGLTNKAIAVKLGITDHTVKFHVNAIMNKLNAQSRTDAVIKATRAGKIVL